MEAGEDIIIARAGKPVALLIQYKAPAKPVREPGSMKGKIKIKPGFYKADNEIEAMFYLVNSIEAVTGQQRPNLVAGGEPSTIERGANRNSGKRRNLR